MTFVQIIEFTTSRIDEFDTLLDGWLERTQGKRTAIRGIQAQDRDRPNTYLHIIEFPSYEDAMANSALAETAEISGRLAALCDEPPAFRNLDVRNEMKM